MLVLLYLEPTTEASPPLFVPPQSPNLLLVAAVELGVDQMAGSLELP